MITHHNQHRHQSGAALLAVLWVIAMLIGLVAGVSLLLTFDLDSAADRRQIFRARMVAEGALAIAMNPAIEMGDPLLKRQISEDEAYEVQIIGEDGLLNPNMLLGVSSPPPPPPLPGVPPPPVPTAPAGNEEVLRRVFIHWGMKFDQANKLINAMRDWVDTNNVPSVGNGGAESKEYGNNGMPYNRPFRSLEEMALVRGMQEVERAYPEWRSWFSVYAGSTIDLKFAKPEIIAAVAGCRIEQAQQLSARFKGRDGILNTEDDIPVNIGEALTALGVLPAAASFFSITSQTKRYVVRVQIGDLVRELSAVAQGSPPAPGAPTGGAQSSILWMSEANPIKNDAVPNGSLTR